MKESRGNRLDDLYRNYARTLYYYLYKMSGSKEIAEDLTQETFIKATVSLSFYKQEDVRAWLFKVARNAYLDEWRKRQRRNKIPFAGYLFSKGEMISPYGLPEDSALYKESKENVADLMSCLPEQYRSILYLREFESFSYSEIQEALDLTENQVKVTLHRARKKLSQLADEKWREKHE
ncbi:RNA polymerase sigma-70 factor, ECF subfamily [Bacillus sp. ZZV12-4809]|nr:RNA polymerase sigma-70 factor, ECF subfamily [Bacillus sp. ZZV12-4809]